MYTITIVSWRPNIENTTNQYFIQTAVTISELATFNTTVLTKMSSAQAFHAARKKPTPGICSGQFLQWYARKLGLVRKIFAISPNHSMKIQEQMGNTVNTSKEKFLVYSLSLQYELFTTAATDSIDAIPKSSFQRTITCNNQDIHELYDNSRNISKTSLLKQS